jgi:type IV pilus assembly protein PilA
MRASNRQAGFTIIEVLIVTVIIGVLLALVLPNVRVNSARARMSEAMAAFGPCRATITEVYALGGNSPGPGNWGCEIPSNASTYVDIVSTTSVGVIKISLHGFGNLRIDTHTLTLAPLDNTGNLPSGNGAPVTSWRCGNGPIDGTDVPAQYLPGTCRG